jgi:predicted nucleic acid-binding protein
MPAVRAFIDSNILLYSILEDDRRKMLIARQLLGDVLTVVSPQILLETTNVLIRRTAIGPLDAARLLRPFIDGELAPTTDHTVRESWRIADRYGFQIYDATVVASAIGARCPTLYTEDLQHDQRIESVRVVNPFL